MPDRLKTIDGQPRSTVTLQRISPRHIYDDGENPRKNPQDIEANVQRLMESIRLHGFKIDGAITVYEKEKKYYRMNGQCRHLATLRLLEEGVDIQTIPVIVKTGQGDPKDRLIGMLMAQETRTLGPLDLAHSYARLESFGLDVAQIAQALVKSEGHVRDMLALLDAGPEVIVPMQAKEITQGQAVKIVRASRSTGESQAALVVKAKEQTEEKRRLRRAEVSVQEKVLGKFAALEEKYGVDVVRQAAQQYLGGL